MRANDFGTGVGIMGKGVINPLVFLFAAGIDMIMRPVCGADRPALHHCQTAFKNVQVTASNIDQG